MKDEIIRQIVKPHVHKSVRGTDYVMIKPIFKNILGWSQFNVNW